MASRSSYYGRRFMPGMPFAQPYRPGLFRRSNATAFTRFKRPSFKGRSSSRTRVATRSPFRRAVTSRRSTGSLTPGLSKLHTPTIPKYIIPKNADRCRVTNEYSMHSQLTWGNTAESFIGCVIQPFQLGAESLTVGPFQGVWPASGGGVVNVSNQRSLPTTPGLLTVDSRYKNYMVESIEVVIKVTRQSSADASTVTCGMCPLNAVQASQMVLRNTTASPAVNLNQWMPGKSITTTGTGATIYGSEFQAVKQQPYVKMKNLINPVGGKPFITLRQSYKVEKFLPMGYPYDANNYGIVPQTLANDGTSPVNRTYHYFFMFNDQGAASPANEDFDIDWLVRVHCIYSQPTFTSFAPTLSLSEGGGEGKEEKKEEKDEEDDLEDNGMDFTNLSLSTPKKPYTCLNPKHPPGHTPSSTCV